MDWLLTSVSASLAISDNGKSQINSETREPLMADPASGSNIQICSLKFSHRIFQCVELATKVKWTQRVMLLTSWSPWKQCWTMRRRDEVLLEGRQWGRTVEFWEHQRGFAGENWSQGVGGKHTHLLHHGCKGWGFGWPSPWKRLSIHLSVHLTRLMRECKSFWN